jgi:hypothetical protein
MHALVATYCLADGTSEAEHAELCEQLAPAFAAFPGLASLTWLANGDTGCYGGFYVFETRAAFDRFVASELFETLRSHGSLRELRSSDYAINDGPTAVTGGPRS